MSSEMVVNHPSHYTFGQYEVIDVLDDWFPDQPYAWQIVKYVARARHKGNELQDLRKAQFYLNRLIAQKVAADAKAEDAPRTEAREDKQPTLRTT